MLGVTFCSTLLKRQQARAFSNKTEYVQIMAFLEGKDGFFSHTLCFSTNSSRLSSVCHQKRKK